MRAPSSVLVFLFGIIGAIFAYMAFQQDQKYAYAVIPCVLLIAAIVSLSPQVDWAWYSRNPSDLSEDFQELLKKKMSIYNFFPSELKLLHRQRIGLFMMAQDFMPQGYEKVPLDIQFMVSAQATLLTLNMDDFLFPKFEKVILYRHPFPSPQFPNDWHSSEIYEQDGVVLFNNELIVRSFMEPSNYFNPVYYEYFRVFCIQYPHLEYPKVSVDDLPVLEKISKFPIANVYQSIGLQSLDLTAVAACYYFVFHEAFRKEHFELYQAFSRLFGLAPLPDSFGNRQIQKLN